MKVALATDHAGLHQARELAAFLESLGHQVAYFGPERFDPTDDYPDFIVPAALAVAKNECQRGVILGGSGQGEAMAANRLNGVRCAVFYGPSTPKGVIDAEGDTSNDAYEIIKLSRTHNDANILSLAARFVSLTEMKHVVKLWLSTEFKHEERHARRIAKLDQEP